MAGASRLTPPVALVLEAVRQALPEGRFVIALSGGADSAIAAWSVAQAVGRESVRAVHVHHGQMASDELAAAARAIAEMIGVGLTKIEVEVPKGPSFESHARDVRLEALAGEAEPGEWLVTGHHADDSVETVLMNLMRGAGAAGLSGIARVRDVWVRPLLDVDRKTVRAAASELKLPYFDDPANLDERYRRNMVRSSVVRWLEERFDVPVRKVIGRSAAALAADDTAHEASAATVPIGTSAGAITAPAVVLSTLPLAVASRAARRVLRRVHPPYAGSAADVAAILRVARGEVARQNLSGGFFAARENANIVLYVGSLIPPDPVGLSPGDRVGFGPWRLSASSASADPGPFPIGRSRVRVSAAAFAGRGLIRAAEEGERIELVSGSKTVRDAMREGGIPARLRPAWPVVTLDGKIAWLAGVRVAGWARAVLHGGASIDLTIEGTGV